MRIDMKKPGQMEMQIDIEKPGPIVFLASIILSLCYPIFHSQIVLFVARNFSSDHNITPEGERQLIFAYYFGMLLLFAVGFWFLKAQDESWRTKIRRIFLGEPLCPATPVPLFPRFALVAATLIGLFLIVNMRVSERVPAMFDFFYKKDHGLLDLSTTVNMIISVVLLSTAVWRLWREPKLTKARIILAVAYLFVMAAFVFDAGEETSWGQNFFNWSTPQVFSGNVENETNLHNFFNAYFGDGYIALVLILVVVLASVALEYNQRWLPYVRSILPHPSLIGLGLVIAFVAIVWYPEQEVLEEMIGAFALFYSLRIFLCFRSQSLSIDT